MCLHTQKGGLSHSMENNHDTAGLSEGAEPKRGIESQFPASLSDGIVWRVDFHPKHESLFITGETQKAGSSCLSG